VGRQPWIVYGLLRTRDAVSKIVPASHVLFSLVLFSIIYALLGTLWLYLLRKEIVHGPSVAAVPPEMHPAIAGARLQES
jgi:cytochrome d ubiquinol oxidase subunit I